MQFWIIQSLNSLALGGLLFLLASGFSLIFGLMRIANLTHGAFFMLGAYFGATALRSYGSYGWMNLWVAAVAGGLGVAVIGGILERLVLRRLSDKTLGQVLVTLGLLFVISYACLVSWGGDPIPVSTPAALRAPTFLFGFAFPTYRLVLVGLALFAAAVLYAILDWP